MTRDELEELAKRLVRHAAGEANELEDDLLEAAALLRSLLAQEPVAWCHLEQWKSGQYWPDDCFASQRLEGTVPLYAVPVPAADPEWKAEAMRLKIGRIRSSIITRSRLTRNVAPPLPHTWTS
jgi:hypothetical protein